jgi:ribonuclease E
MAKRMLIDAAHPEETRVVVLNGHRLEEFDFETSTKKQIKGNIYLAKVTRVEPSLQAAFVEYGGNRHGFLAFGEIHPDYYRIPVADRQAAIEADRVAEEAANEREDAHVEAGTDGGTMSERMSDDNLVDHVSDAAFAHDDSQGDHDHEEEPTNFPEMHNIEPSDAVTLVPAPSAEFEPLPPHIETAAEDDASQSDESLSSGEIALPGAEDANGTDTAGNVTVEMVESAVVEHRIETVGGDEIEETTRPRTRSHRHYKIQEVIKRRQIMLVQVTKEERGNKGAALTTYISLAGRYCVLMPNTPRGGGVSRKITSMQDRRRLKDLMSDLEVPEGMGVIVRTAGSERSKPEIKRDFEYLMRLWDGIRDLTLQSTAPALIYEEGNLIKRSIRDLYTRDLEEVLVDGREGYETAKSFMRMLMPSHTKRVKLYNDPSVPLLHRFQVEAQLDLIHSPVVQLRSGGYIVINPTEALVAIDVNSGRSTRERNIEETALKTNIEAAEEVARQLRLRDLAGLIVIDFIDMEEHRHNGAVERKIKEAMRYDRARIQLGRISPFGLLELSRQRLRPSLLEASTQPCPHCGGSGNIRSTESTALHVLRAIEEEGMRRRTADITVAVPKAVALYVLNQKRTSLQLIEGRYGCHVTIDEDDTLIPPAFRLDRVRAFTPAEIAALPVPQPLPAPEEDDGDEAIMDDDDIIADEAEESDQDSSSGSGRWTPSSRSDEDSDDESEGDEEGQTSSAEGEPQGDGQPRKRRRRRRGRGRVRDGEAAPADESSASGAEANDETGSNGNDDDGTVMAEGGNTEASSTEAGSTDSALGEGERKRRRRGRRGGRRRRHGEGPEGQTETDALAEGSSDTESSSFEAEEGSSIDVSTPSLPEAPQEIAETSQHEAEPVPMPVPAPVAPTPPQRAEAPPALPPEPETETERAPAAYNVPPAQEVTGPPPNPKRGWWRR